MSTGIPKRVLNAVLGTNLVWGLHIPETLLSEYSGGVPQDLVSKSSRMVSYLSNQPLLR